MRYSSNAASGRRRRQSQIPRSLSHHGRLCFRWTSQRCPWLGCIRRQRPWRRHPCTQKLAERCFAALRQLRHLRRYVTNDCFRSLVASLVHSRLDYGNFMFVGLPAIHPTTPSGRTQCCRSSGVPTSSLTTTSLTPSRYCTGCVCRNKSISSWRWWRTVCWTVWRRRTWINLFQYPALMVVAVYGRLSYCSCSSRHTVCQQSAVARFRSQPLCSGALCQMTFSLHHQFLLSVDF